MHFKNRTWGFKWLQNKILIPESEKCYYLYEQSFSYNGLNYKRRGVITALKLTPYTEKIVLPHELTMNGPKADAAFILEPIAIDTVFDRARQGRIMPQKSTFFYPKLPSGLVLYNMDLSL